MLTHQGDQAVGFSVTSNADVKKKRRLRGNAGFTLIELMIVVAIIGILVAIAIPNFMSYQAKARQSEAKFGLGGIFTAATAFYAVNATYTVASFSELDYAAAGSPVYSYNYGGIAINSGSSASACPGTTWVGPSPAISATGFTAGARGNIDSDPTCDEWIIDDLRNLTNTISDVLL
ncbi:MAG TPA: prepilin-type N-terminal cleavage/methylation domain-containing protein [Nitrospiraceae bacterium]|jgi:type IV pilus assembly protein PilA|nr:prepilin-type N-terminal cleavage/methylation domain-containing protein [Nitrospiraceae bacterium]